MVTSVSILLFLSASLRYILISVLLVLAIGAAKSFYAHIRSKLPDLYRTISLRLARLGVFRGRGEKRRPYLTDSGKYGRDDGDMNIDSSLFASNRIAHRQYYVEEEESEEEGAGAGRDRSSRGARSSRHRQNCNGRLGTERSEGGGVVTLDGGDDNSVSTGLAFTTIATMGSSMK